MALDARTRSSIYGKFAQILGADDANALMSEFPSVEADELVTREHLRAELGLLRAELGGEISGLRDEIGGLRGEMRGEIGGLRGEMRGEIGGLRGEMRGEIGGLRGEMRGEIGALRLEMAERFHRQTVWLASTVVASAGVVIAAVPLLS